MSIYTRGKKRDKSTFVTVYTGLLYGFKTKDLAAISSVTAADLLSQLGHISGTTPTPAGSIKVLGARSPKPPRVTKRIPNAGVGAQQSVSTFCSYPTLTAAMQGGWTVTKTRRGVSLRSKDSSKNTLTAIATLSDGSMYCFPMNKADFSTYKDALGLTSADALGTISDLERAKLVSGSTIPRPGKASIELSGGGIFSSFYSTSATSAAATAGFSIATDEIVFAPSP
jgi:hypothetical protein